MGGINENKTFIIELLGTYMCVYVCVYGSPVSFLPGSEARKGKETKRNHTVLMG